MKQRIEWLDNLRAIAIFFVVLGHTVGLPEHVEKLIFSDNIFNIKCFGGPFSFCERYNKLLLHSFLFCS